MPDTVNMAGERPVYGLSCVENQILRLLDGRDWDITRLYANSAIPMKELFYRMVRQGERFERFECIPRIQTLLREEGLLSVTMYTSGAAEALAAARRVGKNDAVLAMVRPVFARNILGARGLRDDHYVRALPEGEGLRLFNDIPATEAFLPAAEWENAYAGRYLHVAVLRDDTPEDDRKRHARRLFRAEELEPFRFFPEDLAGVEWPEQRLRDLAGVYKLSRHQMREYYAAYTDTSFMEEPIRRAEKRYALLEYLNLKQGVSRERLFDLLTELNEEDVLLTKQLREQLTSHGGTTAESDEKERGKEMVSVKQTVNDVVASLTMLEGRSEGTIAEETLLREELGFDSLKMVELVVSLEEAFAIQIDEADLDPQAFDTVGDLYRLVDQYLAC